MRADPFANMTMVDLSLPIYDDAPIWSAEPRCIVHNWIVLGRKHGQLEPLNMKYFCMSGHQGTHTDAPYHMNPNGLTVSDIPLSRYMGWCKVLDFTDKKLGDRFTANRERALKHYNRALELKPRLAQAYMYRGVLFTQMGDLARARADHAKLLGLDRQLAAKLERIIAGGGHDDSDGLAPQYD